MTTIGLPHRRVVRTGRRSVCRLLLAALILCTAPALAQSLPVAVWYGGGKARAPMLEDDPRARRDAWRADMRQIKATGFDTIRCWIDWASAEPREREYHFETLEVLTELAAELGMKVILQVYVDSAPEWVGKKFPDAHFVSISGDVMPSHAAPGYCVDHPGVGAAVLSLYSAIAERMKGRAAFLGWDLWSEPHVINWAQATYLPSAEFCFCPHSVARFRTWLKHQYGSLDAINVAWYRRFESWDDVAPNRLSTILSYTDYIDWRFFIADKLAEDLRARYDAVKRVLPDRVATSHAAAPNLFTSPLAGDGSPSDWKMAKVVDFWGTSFYPKHSFPVGRDPAWRSALLDFTRSASGDRGFWVGELQAGFGTVALRISSTVTPSDLRTWMWSTVGHGAKAVNVYAWYPMSSGYESGGFGLIELDGTITERARAAGKVAQAIGRNAELLGRARPERAEVAIVYNPMSYMVGGRRPLVAATAQGEVVNVERNSLLGTYRALFPSNIPVDFIHADEIGDVAARYKVIFLPYPLMIREPSARALAAFVRGGGTLVAEARAAWNDDRGRATEIIPGHGLHEVCDCRESAVQSTPTGKTEIELTSDFAGLKAGEKIRGVLYEESFAHGERARSVGKFADGSSALVVSTYGKGRMIALGTFIGTAYEADRDANTARLIRGIVEEAGVVAPVESDAPLEIRILRSGSETIVMAFNHEGVAREATIRIRGTGNATARDLESGETLRVEGGTLRRKFAPNDVRVWSIR